jgi:hypothetical protein
MNPSLGGAIGLICGASGTLLTSSLYTPERKFAVLLQISEF